LGAVKPGQVSVELYADGINGLDPVTVKMDCSSTNTLKGQEYSYFGKVDSSRNPGDYTVRIIPQHEGVSVPLEENLIH
jgi:starch phosphorylase